MSARSFTLNVSCAYLQINRSYIDCARFASTMAKFDAETLIKYATQTEKALTEKTLSALGNLSPNVVLHQEAFTLNHDIKGEAEVKKYLQTYFDKYEFEHDTLNYAVNPDTSCSFALSYDKVSSAVYVVGCLWMLRLLLCALILIYSRFDVTCWLQNVHLKNKGSLPAEAVKPASTIGQQLCVVPQTTHPTQYMACLTQPQATLFALVAYAHQELSSVFHCIKITFFFAYK